MKYYMLLSFILHVVKVFFFFFFFLFCLIRSENVRNTSGISTSFLGACN